MVINLNKGLLELESVCNVYIDHEHLEQLSKFGIHTIWDFITCDHVKLSSMNLGPKKPHPVAGAWARIDAIMNTIEFIRPCEGSTGTRYYEIRAYVDIREDAVTQRMAAERNSLDVLFTCWYRDPPERYYGALNARLDDILKEYSEFNDIIAFKYTAEYDQTHSVFDIHPDPQYNYRVVFTAL